MRPMLPGRLADGLPLWMDIWMHTSVCLVFLAEVCFCHLHSFIGSVFPFRTCCPVRSWSTVCTWQTSPSWECWKFGVLEPQISHQQVWFQVLGNRFWPLNTTWTHRLGEIKWRDCPLDPKAATVFLALLIIKYASDYSYCGKHFPWQHRNTNNCRIIRHENIHTAVIYIDEEWYKE